LIDFECLANKGKRWTAHKGFPSASVERALQSYKGKQLLKSRNGARWHVASVPMIEHLPD
jgi:hypothetical protein